MFKEFLMGAALFFALWLVLRAIFRKRGGSFSFISLMVTLALLCLASVIYNAVNIFPDTYMETSTGTYRYGTMSGNLFAYSDGFRYRDEIIFPILRGRTVTLASCGEAAGGASAGFYSGFFEMFSEGLSDDIIPVKKDMLERIREDSAFDYTTPFNCIGLMDYAKAYVPATLYGNFRDKVFPNLHINTASLKEDASLIVLVAEDYSVYLMGERYFRELT